MRAALGARSPRLRRCRLRHSAFPTISTAGPSALGTILASEDGGRNWRCQRAGGARAALLGMVTDETDAPLELLARLSGNEGYLSVVEVLGRRDLEVPPRDEAHAADRVHEAVVAVGGCGASTAWQFPLRQPGLQLSAKQIIDGWDQFHGGRGLLDLEAHLVRQVRVWRPEVIVTRRRRRPRRRRGGRVDCPGVVECGPQGGRCQRVCRANHPSRPGAVAGEKGLCLAGSREIAARWI